MKLEDRFTEKIDIVVEADPEPPTFYGEVHHIDLPPFAEKEAMDLFLGVLAGNEEVAGDRPVFETTGQPLLDFAFQITGKRPVEHRV